MTITYNSDRIIYSFVLSLHALISVTQFSTMKPDILNRVDDIPELKIELKEYMNHGPFHAFVPE